MASQRDDAPARWLLADLIERERDPTLERLRRWVGAPAEDIFQEAALRALERLPQLEDPRRLRAWFFRLLSNGAISFLRTRRSTWESLPATPFPGEPSALPPHLLPTTCSCALDILPRMKASQRQVLQDAVIDEQPLAVHARNEDLSANNARVRLHRARRALHRRLLSRCGTCARERGLDCDCPSRDPMSTRDASVRGSLHNQQHRDSRRAGGANNSQSAVHS